MALESCCRFRTSSLRAKPPGSASNYPARGEYGVGQVFLPLDAVKRKECEDAFERIVNEEGQRIVGWRDVPVVESACGDIARRGMPSIRQVLHWVSVRM